LDFQTVGSLIVAVIEKGVLGKLFRKLFQKTHVVSQGADFLLFQLSEHACYGLANALSGHGVCQLSLQSLHLIGILMGRCRIGAAAVAGFFSNLPAH
jgi:hypothetical protein